MCLFDTDIISNLFKKEVSPNLVERLSGLGRNEQFVSTISIGEIVYGAFKSNNPDFHLNNLYSLILQKINVIFFDRKSAFYYGSIRAHLEKQGKPLNHIDLQIASIALSNNLILITGNEKHFMRINDLKIENWLK